jgi:4-alpha-glucanotransferase
MMPFEAVHERLLEALFRCNSWLAVVMITDLLGSDQRFNVPGSVGDMNWSARLPVDWAAQASGHNARIAAVLQASGRG